jgi:uncharacterized membrane protein HdeD (DUF308 family)
MIAHRRRHRHRPLWREMFEPVLVMVCGLVSTTVGVFQALTDQITTFTWIALFTGPVVLIYGCFSGVLALFVHEQQTRDAARRQPDTTAQPLDEP